jgi:hypothetical protein
MLMRIYRLYTKLPKTYLDGARRSLETPPWQMNHEVFHSWAMLFATDQNSTKRASDYAQLSQPYWFQKQVKSHPESGEPKYSILRMVTKMLSVPRRRVKHIYQRGDPLRPHQGAIDTSFRRPFTDEGYQRILTASLNKNTIPYSQFPAFETRLRQLRSYMDSQKPRGIRQLWHDNRDSLNYYTFWGVIIFGGLSVFLALFSLAVGIAQAVASFQALHLSSSPPSPS